MRPRRASPEIPWTCLEALGQSGHPLERISAPTQEADRAWLAARRVPRKAWVRKPQERIEGRCRTLQRTSTLLGY